MAGEVRHSEKPRPAGKHAQHHAPSSNLDTVVSLGLLPCFPTVSLPPMLPALTDPVKNISSPQANTSTSSTSGSTHVSTGMDTPHHLATSTHSAPSLTSTIMHIYPSFDSLEIYVAPEPTDPSSIIDVSVRTSLPCSTDRSNRADLPFSPPTIHTLTHGAYPYTADLRALNDCIASRPLPPIPGLKDIVSPLRYEAWSQALRNHPDQSFISYLQDGLRGGFRIGFRERSPLMSSKRNMSSALENPSPVVEYLAKEVEEKRVIGPLSPQLASVKGVHTSRFGGIPKRHQPGKWRLILDLSSPQGFSVNEGIDRHLCSLQFASVDSAARIVARLGRGAFLAKVDISHAYRNVPVHPVDRQLLGMVWDDHLYIDTALPFGLRSAPKIFCAVSDALEWVLVQRGVSSCLHYVDDFLTVGAPQSSECLRNLELITATCGQLGVPLAAHKVEGPANTLTFLGVEIDAINLVLRLPEEKQVRLQQLVVSWLSRKAAKKRELLSLIGQLAHACKVVVHGRTFLRRMINLASSRSCLDHWIRVTASFRSDLFWWHLFMARWNGSSVLSAHLPTRPDFHLFTDASGSWGCGALCNHDWFHCPWPVEWTQTNIATKELVPIVLAVGLWGSAWKGLHILVRSDNMAVVELLRSRSSRDPDLMQLLRCLHFLAARYDISLAALHIRGVDNIAADALSRNDLSSFFSSHPQANPQPSRVPQPLWELVVSVQPDWLSPAWRLRLQNI